jgi:hypothetical protein
LVRFPGLIVSLFRFSFFGESSKAFLAVFAVHDFFEIQISHS